MVKLAVEPDHPDYARLMGVLQRAPVAPSAPTSRTGNAPVATPAPSAVAPNRAPNSAAVPGKPTWHSEVIVMGTTLLSASHSGVIRFGDLECAAVVLSDGSRGYVQGQLARTLGLREKSPGTQIAGLIREFASNSLPDFEKKGYAKVRLPTGQTGTFFPAGIVPELAMGIIGVCARW